MTNKIEAGIELLASSGGDIAEIISKLGGVINVMKVAPAAYRLFKTWNDLNATHPDDAVPYQYSDATAKKVRAFQKAHGLEEDGVVGDKTWAKAEALLKS